ncbi:hypothetical protein CU098_011771 [Rhizopus stolonifer]|uniref:assimilatory sulfite reductase (NADPH) n=1 Tax=Rhizopus stolonifer TaxID=4846 RepID=A0A367KUV2_RHIST|nr:hypothetical protein CU098_011771 [Rhizopus stolonifer]
MPLKLLSGEDASMKASQALSEHIYTYKPINQTQDENIWKKKTSFTIYNQSGLLLDQDRHAAALISSHTLISVIPQLYQLAQGNVPVVIHVSAESTEYSFADFSQVMAVRQSGLALLSSSTVQEAHDLAIIAHMVAIKTHTPILHFFDSKRIADEYATIQVVEPSVLSQLITPEDLENYQHYQSPKPPATAYLQYKQPVNKVDIYTAVQEAMVQFATLTDRHYSPLEYIGHSDAESVVIAMGAGASVVEQTVKSLGHKNKGVLKVRLYRPWSDKNFMSRLPKSVKRIAVLEPSKNLASAWNPLFLDVVSAFQDNYEVEIVSGQYGVQDQDFSPGHAQAVFEVLAQPEIQRKFEVSSLPQVKSVVDLVAEEEFILAGEEKLAIEYAERATTAGRYAQVYTLDGVSHVRVSSTGSLLPSLISGVKAVALVQDIDSLSNAAKQAISKVKLVIFKQVKDLELGLVAVLAKADEVVAPQEWPQLSTRAPVQETTETSVETPYLKMLDQVFQDRLEVANAVQSASVWSVDQTQPNSAAPEFGYGKILNYVQERARFVDTVEKLVKSSDVQDISIKSLTLWLMAVKSKSYDIKTIQRAADIVLATTNEDYIFQNHEYLYMKSNWLIGSDSWAQDLGQSGVHHVIAQGENVNMLIIDSGNGQSRKDIGLYAMNFGHVYVASVAIYSSYTGVLHALMEADAYQGPSVVLAYFPHPQDPIQSLKQTKIAVDNGSWPLYRWNPTLESQGKEPFSLDSQRIKRDLEKFLERENHFSQIVSQHPNMSTLLVSSLEKDLKNRHSDLKHKARDDYAKLLSGLGAANGPSLTILFGSDNGNAEGVAKRLAKRGESRGLQMKWMALDDYPDVQDLANETNLVFVISTAGQGEFPSNSRDLWKALAALNGGDIPFGELRYAVFGMGDSLYWPREEDAVYYNRPAKLVDAKLESLGAKRLLDIGLGDDQDEDGYETAFGAWQAEFWKSLGVNMGDEVEEPKITDDQMKINSNYLRGTIAQDIADESKGDISETNGKLLKFHGSYGQDDRDIREERKKMGLEKAYSFMIRVRMPGGAATPAQWLTMDKLADDYANGAIKCTTRQSFQLHGVLKKNLRTTIRSINHSLLSTLAACGDVNRNIMITPITEIPEVQEQVQAFGYELMKRMAPQTTAYHELWLADEQVAGNAVQDFEPIYGVNYLPRKFKIVIAVPPSNDIDIFAHDLGFIAIVDNNKKVVGYNVTMGGGMGMTHGNKKTYPRNADLVGYIPAELGVKCAEAVVTTQRDHGDRMNRKHARFKYTIDTYGLDYIKNEVEVRMGAKFQDIVPFEFKDNADRYGWTKGVGDKWHFCMFIENGKVKDWPDFRPKSGLRELAQWHKGEFRLSPNQHIVIANVPEADLEKTKALLAKYKMDNLAFSGLRKNAMACVALPTCGLAMAESERYLPILVAHLEKAIEASGLRDDAITIRMTGCPNGCSRPYLGEIAFVGKAPNTYNVYLGGGRKGDRLNKLYKESLKEEEILAEINPIIKRYALERLDEEESFGDFVLRAGYVKRTITGTDFHDL